MNNDENDKKSPPTEDEDEDLGIIVFSSAVFGCMLLFTFIVVLLESCGIII